jgi:hypothetical protein
MPVQGWHRDPSGAHDERWFSAGSPTSLVRDGGLESREDLPADQQGERREPLDHAAIAAEDQSLAVSYAYPFWSVVALRCALVFIAGGVIVAWSLSSQPTSGFELARAAVTWVQVDRAVQLVACLAAAALLFAAVRIHLWRRAIGLAVLGIVPLQVGLALLSGSQYPGDSCWAQPQWATITLSFETPAPAVTVAPGARIFVTVPGGWNGPTSDVYASAPGIIREDCTVSLPGGGRRAVITAIRPGSTAIVSEEQPTDSRLPNGGGLGKVVVQAASR